jgi:hypothetical protein
MPNYQDFKRYGKMKKEKKPPNPPPDSHLSSHPDRG